MRDGRHPASFRDPSGFVFRHEGVLFRKVNQSYRQHYEHLLDSGLYDELVSKGMLVSHEEVDSRQTPFQDEAFKVLKPLRIPFLSYPYEWCFSELRDAALLTLDIQDTALRHGMSLKDGSAFNVQFVGGRPVFIDTLSFEIRNVDRPWPPYGQFCRHFLCPLVLAAQSDPRTLLLLRAFPDGIPLDLASRLLPSWTRLRPGLGLHIHAHARFLRKRTGEKAGIPRAHRPFGKSSLLGLIDHLRSTLTSLSVPSSPTAWTFYSPSESYTDRDLQHKRRWVADTLSSLAPGCLWDLGANSGDFSWLAADAGLNTVALDSDHGAVEACYGRTKADCTRQVLPLVMDLMNPSGGTGWLNEERASLLARGPVEAVMALAWIHHLAIGNNLPLASIAAFLRRCAPAAIVEFVPKEDPQVRRMLALKGDIFPDYSSRAFEASVSSDYRMVRRETLPDGGRILYHLQAWGT